MAVDKLVDSTQLDTDLTSVANAIRTKGGTSAQLAFPAGFVSAIAAIPTGGATGGITQDQDGYLVVSDQAGGGGGVTLDWATIQEVTIGANAVTNASGVSTYFSGYNYKFIMLASDLTTNNQFVFGYSQSSDGTMTTAYRWRNGAIGQTIITTSYDYVLVEGTKYYLIFE